MTRGKLLGYKQTWITLAIIIAAIGLGQSIRDTFAAATKDPQGEAASKPTQQKTQFKSVDIQVPAGVDAAQAAQAISPEELDIGTQPLSSFYFYLDPGHNAAGGPSGDCGDRGTGGWQPNTNLYEGDLTWNIASALKSKLLASGVPSTQIVMSRPTANKYVTVQNRVDGTAATGYCTTMGNNQAFRDKGRPTDRWRFVSIHLNGGGGGTERVEVFRKVRGWGFPTIPLAGEFAENMSWQLNRPYPHPNAPYYGDWTNAYNSGPDFCDDEPLPCDLYVVRNSLPRAFEDTRSDCVSYGWCHHGSYNILTELGYLDNPGFNAWIAQSGNQDAEAQALFRGLADFFVAGRPPGSLQNKDAAIFEDYRQNILQGRDPGVPFDNGGGYYVHQYATAPALTQEFNSPSNTKGSILKPLSGGAAYYVRDPMWSTYIQKGGPNSSGPGLPIGEEHSISILRRVGGGIPTPVAQVYPQVVNFQRGAITYNSQEGGMSSYQNQHAIFLPNCNADGIQDQTFGAYLRGMVGRFALSNDYTTFYDPRLPETMRYGGGYNDAGLHVYDLTTRGELAQSLVWAEARPYYVGSDYEFRDLTNPNPLWSRPWVRTAASLFIANGYPCGAPFEPCPGDYFRPNNTATRGQFAKMETIARGWTTVTPAPTHSSQACGSPGDGAAGGIYSFEDVCYRVWNGNAWVANEFYTWIETVKAHNAIGGYPCGTNQNEPCNGYTDPDPYFRPGNDTNRGQMSKIIDAALTNDGFQHQACWYADMPQVK